MTRLSVFILLGILISMLIIPGQLSLASGNDASYIRIKLSGPYRSNVSLDLYGEGGFLIFDKDDLDDEVGFIKSSTIKITIRGRDEIYIVDDNNDLVFSYNRIDDFIITSPSRYGWTIGLEGKNYRDYIGFRIVDESLIPINYIDLENYLYGVVPKEMSSSFEMEALKAQAIAARTYTLKNINKHRGEGFDLCDTTHCQVYGGMDCEQPKTNTAVDETKGMIATFDGDIIDALYHSNSGGATASSLEAFGSGLPYLASVRDEFSCDYPNSDWSLNLTADEINNILKENDISIGRIRDMEIVELSPAGRVIQLRLIGSQGERILKGSQIRQVFGNTKLRSTWFTLDKGNDMGVNRLYAIDDLSSRPQLIKSTEIHVIDGSFKSSPSRGLISRFVNRDGTVEIPGAKITTIYDFTIKGRGYGHGVGMSQWGAQGMAVEGYTFMEILKHYYRGIDLTIID